MPGGSGTSLLNLLSNATHHEPPGNVIVVELAKCRGRVGLSITDQGASPGPNRKVHRKPNLGSGWASGFR